jgi:hypothetical protein
MQPKPPAGWRAAIVIQRQWGGSPGGLWIRLAHGSLNALALASGRTVVGRVDADAGAQFQKFRPRSRARSAIRQMLLDMGCLGGIRFIVQVGLQETLRRHARHLEASFMRVATQSCRLWRARDSRDITVPIGALAA